MIWIGRLISIPVGVVFFVLLMATLLVLRVNDTFLDPDYYPEQLREADVYSFVLVDLLTVVVDEERERERREREKQEQAEPESGEQERNLLDDLLLTSGLTTDQIVSSVNRAIPPIWVQELVEQSFDQLGEYVTGERDDFEYTLKAGERADILVEELLSLLREADAYNLVYDELVIPEIKKAAEGVELPLGVDVPAERIVEAAQRIAPADWVQAQVETVVGQVKPYFLGQRDSFEISLEIGNRVTIALEEIKSLLRDVDEYDLLYDEMVEPQLIEFIGESVDLPFGVAVTRDEVLDALRRVAPEAWVQQQVEAVIDEAGPYLAGQSDTFQIDISLIDIKREAREVIVGLVDERLNDLLSGLRRCTSLAEAQAALTSRDELGLPSCLPADVTPSFTLDRLDIDVVGQVSRLVLDPIPGSIEFSHNNLRQSITATDPAQGEEFLASLDQARKILAGGVIYSHENLRNDLVDEELGETVETSDEVERLDEVRAFLADGVSYSSEELHALQPLPFLPDKAPDLDQVNQLDTVRGWFRFSRTYRLVIYVPLLVLLVTLGFLGGRSWSGRVAYAAAVLAVSAGFIFLVFGPVYGAVVKSELEGFQADALSEFAGAQVTVFGNAVDSPDFGKDFPAAGRLAANKVFDIAENVANEFAGGVAWSGFVIGFVALLVFAGTVFWSSIMSLVDRYWSDRERELGRWFR